MNSFPPVDHSDVSVLCDRLAEHIGLACDGAEREIRASLVQLLCQLEVRLNPKLLQYGHIGRDETLGGNLALLRVRGICDKLLVAYKLAGVLGRSSDSPDVDKLFKESLRVCQTFTPDAGPPYLEREWGNSLHQAAANLVVDESVKQLGKDKQSADQWFYACEADMPDEFHGRTSDGKPLAHEGTMKELARWLGSAGRSLQAAHGKVKRAVERGEICLLRIDADQGIYRMYQADRGRYSTAHALYLKDKQDESRERLAR